MRGVQNTGAMTTTSCMLGCLQSTTKMTEFLNFIRRN
jgi:GTP cyclohydrolase I